MHSIMVMVIDVMATNIDAKVHFRGKMFSILHHIVSYNHGCSEITFTHYLNLNTFVSLIKFARVLY